jgi:hypothetical protein
MVKRTVVVLSILALTLTAGMALAGGCDYVCETRPLFVPAPCPDMVPQRMLKTWEAKIVTPLMCGPAGGPGCYGKIKYPWDKACLCNLCMKLGALASPLDWLVSGTTGVYGCTDGLFGKRNRCGMSGSAGPLTGLIGAVPTTFGSYW